MSLWCVIFWRDLSGKSFHPSPPHASFLPQNVRFSARIFKHLTSSVNLRHPRTPQCLESWSSRRQQSTLAVIPINVNRARNSETDCFEDLGHQIIYACSTVRSLLFLHCLCEYFTLNYPHSMPLLVSDFAL